MLASLSVLVGLKVCISLPSFLERSTATEEVRETSQQQQNHRQTLGTIGYSPVKNSYRTVTADSACFFTYSKHVIQLRENAHTCPFNAFQFLLTQSTCKGSIDGVWSGQTEKTTWASRVS